MNETNEIQRCHACGAPLLEDPTQWFCEADPRFTTPDGLGFCEAVYLRRVENDWPIPSFVPWEQEVQRREDLASVSYGPRDRRGSSGGGTCALPSCNEPVTGNQIYHAEKCRQAMYRRRRKGEA